MVSFLKMEMLDWINPTYHSVLHIITAVRKEKDVLHFFLKDLRYFEEI